MAWRTRWKNLIPKSNSKREMVPDDTTRLSLKNVLALRPAQTYKDAMDDTQNEFSVTRMASTTNPGPLWT